MVFKPNNIQEYHPGYHRNRNTVCQDLEGIWLTTELFAYTTGQTLDIGNLIFHLGAWTTSD